MSEPSSPPLTAKQARFVVEYLVDLNASQAGIRAGYSPKTAGVIGYENLKKPQIAAMVAKAQAERAQRTEITIDTVVSELAKLGFAHVDAPPPMVKHAALVSLGKHLGMFTERHVFEGSIEHVLTKMTPAERLARAEQLLVDAERYLPLLEQAEAELEASRQDEEGEVPSTEG